MNFKWPDKRWGLGRVNTEGRRKKSAPLIWHRGNLAEGFQTFCHFQGDVCLPKIPDSSWPGRSISMRLVFMLKEPCDAISIHDEYRGKNTDEPPAFLICNTPTQSAHNFCCCLCSWIMSQIGIQQNNNGSCCCCNVSGLIKSTQIICLNPKLVK